MAKNPGGSRPPDPRRVHCVSPPLAREIANFFCPLARHHLISEPFLGSVSSGDRVGLADRAADLERHEAA